LKYKCDISGIRFFTGILFLLFALVSGCSSKRFVVSDNNDLLCKESRSFPADTDAVWKILKNNLRDYRFQADQKDAGILQTYWKVSVVKNRGRLTDRVTYMHGRMVDDRSDDINQNQMGEFEVKERLSILVNKRTENSSSVTVTYYFNVNTYAAEGVAPLGKVEREGAPFGQKAFSPWDFCNHEEHRILEQIDATLKETTAKGGSAQK
jgi:hypothetical protein